MSSGRNITIVDIIVTVCRQREVFLLHESIVSNVKVNASVMVPDRIPGGTAVLLMVAARIKTPLTAWALRTYFVGVRAPHQGRLAMKVLGGCG